MEAISTNSETNLSDISWMLEANWLMNIVEKKEKVSLFWGGLNPVWRSFMQLLLNISLFFLYYARCKKCFIPGAYPFCSCSSSCSCSVGDLLHPRQGTEMQIIHATCLKNYIRKGTVRPFKDMDLMVSQILFEKQVVFLLFHSYVSIWAFKIFDIKTFKHRYTSIWTIFIFDSEGIVIHMPLKTKRWAFFRRHIGIIYF